MVWKLLCYQCDHYQSYHNKMKPRRAQKPRTARPNPVSCLSSPSPIIQVRANNNHLLFYLLMSLLSSTQWNSESCEVLLHPNQVSSYEIITAMNLYIVLYSLLPTLPVCTFSKNLIFWNPCVLTIEFQVFW